jgi:hypothetical protein
MGSTNFPFNKANLNSLILTGKYTISENEEALLDGKTLTYRDFILKNYKSTDLGITEKEITETQQKECTDKITAKECQDKIKPLTDIKIKKYLSASVNYSQINLDLGDTLTTKTFKQILKSYYSDRIDSVTTQQNSIKDIVFLRGYTSLIEPILPNIVQAIFSLTIFISLFIIKFLIHILTSVLVWLIWKFLLITGFAKIDIELVESEIVSI